VARPHPLGELLLGEPELGATRDHEPGDPLVWRQTLLRSPVLRIAMSPAPGGVCRWGSGRVVGAGAHKS